MSSSQDLARIFANAFLEAGTQVIYGMPGGGNNLDLIGACENVGLRFVLAHGETSAAIMAGVYGELSGAPGACLVTRGPGAASAVNGIANALLDRTPLALVTDAVSNADVLRISHQRLDQRALYRGVTKWSITVGTANAASVVPAALRIASAPPPGPVHLDFVPDAPPDHSPEPRGIPSAGDMSKVEKLLKSCRNPVFVIGLGGRGAVSDVRELLRGRPWPALTTYKAKGVVPEQWLNAAGLITGATIEAPVLRGADVIVAIGLDPVELIPAPWPYPAPIVLLSEWPLRDPYFVPAVELVAPLRESLPFLIECFESKSDLEVPPFGRQSRLIAEKALQIRCPGIAPHEVVLRARAAAPKGTTATIDAGAHMLAAMPLWEVEEPDEVVISSGLATMGFAVPAAISAAIARPGRSIVAFVGDGGLGMTLAELETLSRLALPVVVIVFNDSALSLIEIKQNPAGHGGTSAVRYRETDFAAIARGFGIAAIRVDESASLAGAFAEAFSARRPFLLDVLVDPSGYSAILKATRGGSRG